jgi:hypothetical protein
MMHNNHGKTGLIQEAKQGKRLHSWIINRDILQDARILPQYSRRYS